MKRLTTTFGVLLALCSAQLFAQTRPPVTVAVDGRNIQVLNMDAQDRVQWGGYSQIGKAVSVYMYSGALYNSGKVELNHYVCVRKG